MTTEQLRQEVQELRTQTLTPVSPKPIHFPQPSNIPLLDISMVSDFESSATPPAPAQGVEPVTSDIGHADTLESTADTVMESYDNKETLEPEKLQPSEVPAEQAISSGPIDLAQTDNQAISDAIKSSLDASNAYPPTSAPPLNDAALAFLQSLVMSSAVPVATTPSTSNAFDKPSNLSQVANVPADDQKSSTASADDIVMENGGAGVVNFDALLDNLATPDGTNQAQVADTTTKNFQQNDAAAENTGPPGIHQTPIRLIPTVPSLPARPPVQQAGSDIRTQQSNDQAPAQHGQGLNPQSTSTHMTIEGDDSMSAVSTVGNQQRPGSSMANTQQQDEITVTDTSIVLEPEDEPFSPELQKLYDVFLADERNNMTLNEWDKFPVGSRLFIG